MPVLSNVALDHTPYNSPREGNAPSPQDIVNEINSYIQKSRIDGIVLSIDGTPPLASTNEIEQAGIPTITKSEVVRGEKDIDDDHPSAAAGLGKGKGEASAPSSGLLQGNPLGTSEQGNMPPPVPPAQGGPETPKAKRRAVRRIKSLPPMPPKHLLTHYPKRVDCEI